jgi:hypothetical protein
MSSKDPVNWILAEASDSLARADRLRQQFFSLQPSAGPTNEDLMIARHTWDLTEGDAKKG